ncbi:MAG: CinA family protein [Anaerolineae bacterium]
MSPAVLAERLGALLSTRHLTICAAESCTGGLLADTITDIPGSSRYFLGGLITYSNEAKAKLLDIPSSYLRTFGAVSAPVAIAMARGALKLFGANIALAITGIAGPSGGTKDKPVGLTFISIVAPKYAACQQFIWSHERRGNKQASVTAALLLALRAFSELSA